MWPWRRWRGRLEPGAAPDRCSTAGLRSRTRHPVSRDGRRPPDIHGGLGETGGPRGLKSSIDDVTACEAVQIQPGQVAGRPGRTKRQLKGCRERGHVGGAGGALALFGGLPSDSKPRCAGMERTFAAQIPALSGPQHPGEILGRLRNLAAHPATDLRARLRRGKDAVQSLDFCERHRFGEGQPCRGALEPKQHIGTQQGRVPRDEGREHPGGFLMGASVAHPRG